MMQFCRATRILFVPEFVRFCASGSDARIQRFR